MKAHKTLIQLVFLCMLPPTIAYWAYSHGYHGSGFTNKGLLIKPMIVDKSLGKYLSANKFTMFEIKNNRENLNFSQIKRALGSNSYRVAVSHIPYIPESLKPLFNENYNFFISDPRKNIILAYKNNKMQSYIFKDIKHLIKTN